MFVRSPREKTSWWRPISTSRNLGGMFTGIVRELGTVESFDGTRLVLAANETAAASAVGDSVAVAGVCLTVVEAAEGRLAFDVVPETLARTALGRLEPGSSVNLEPSLSVGDPLGGHVVQGHVDAVGRVRSVTPEGDGRRVWVDAPPNVLGYCIEKGSIAVDGVSLTVAAFDDDGFEAALIPHTLAVTTLGGLAPGAEVNLEADVLGKVVERLVEARLP
jgi:riboflavin synthase